MATKLVIGKAAPKSFPMKVEVPTPHGPCEINFEAKYLPSTEWAKLREAHAVAPLLKAYCPSAHETHAVAPLLEASCPAPYASPGQGGMMRDLREQG